MIQNYRKELITARQNCFSVQHLQNDPLSAVHSFTKTIDHIIATTFNDHLGKISSRTCLVATGGYGRNELCPYSDIDLLIIHEGNHKEENTARCIRALWDMGFPLGCVVRSIAECKKILGEDLATDTSLLETRFLAGDHCLLLKLNQNVVQPYFGRRSQWFLSEMDASFRDGLFSSEQSLYKVEPDIKNGICALRDCQRIIWSQKVASKKIFESSNDHLPFSRLENEQYICAYKNLIRIRCALHMAADKRLDILEFPYQNQVAEMLGMGCQSAGVLMENYFNTVRTIRNYLLKYLEYRKHNVNWAEKIRHSLSAITVAKRLKLLDGILIFHGTAPAEPKSAALWAMDVFRLSLSYQATLSVELGNTLRTVSEQLNPQDLFNEEIAIRFRNLLSTRAPVGTVIRSMHEGGFLEKLIPEFQGLRCKVEYDSYHEFTVDHHTILALCNLDNLNQEKEDGIENITISAGNLFTLRLAVLLHDIGKSTTGDHASTGAAMALSVGQRLNLTDPEKELLVFLIKNHLELSRLAFQRMPEKQVFLDLAYKTVDRTRLDLLYILTVVDIKSVGRKTWTNWKGIQLYETYCSIRDLIDGKETRENQNSSFCLSSNFSSQDFQKRFEQIKSVNDISLTANRHADFVELTVCGIDRPHFFEDIAGCLSSEGYSIISSSIMTSGHLAVDIFQLEPDTATNLSMEQHISNIEKKWHRIANGDITAHKLITERIRRYPPKTNRINPLRKASVTIDNSVSMEFTIIELRTPDRFALLFKIANTLSELGINIISAKLSTLVSLVNDVFYVTGPDGKKIKDPLLLEKISVRLKETISDTRT